MKSKKSFNAVDIMIIVCVALLVLATVFRAQVIKFLGNRENLTEFVLTFESEPVENSYAGYIKSGRNVTWEEKGIEIGEVREISESYAAPIYTVDDSGVLVITQSDNTSILKGTLRIRGAAKDGCFISGTEFVGAGMKMTLRTQNVVFKINVISVSLEE
ncbi:MAG: DUF4330 family protein [Clostridia bacterium]|nr:DUF4330 family protein [Clostridia bacterium]